MDENPVGKRPHGSQDVIRKYVETPNRGQNWKTRAMDMEGWRIGCVMEWS